MFKFFVAASLFVCSALCQTNISKAIQQASLGIDLARKGDYAGAEAAYLRAISLDPALPHIHLNLGLAYFKQGVFGRALDELKKEPSSQQTQTLIAMCHFGQGKYKEAAAGLQRSPPLNHQTPS